MSLTLNSSTANLNDLETSNTITNITETKSNLNTNTDTDIKAHLNKTNKLDFSLTKEQKILHKSQFAKVFNTKNPFKYGNKYFQILAIKNELSFARVGIVASKKQLKRAHERNRAKRLVREQFRLQQHQFTNIDFIVMPRKAFEQSENAELVQQLTKAFTVMHNYFN